MILAIFQSERIYEGNLHFLHAIYPMPAVSKVSIAAPSKPDLYDFGAVIPTMPPIFREDSFDPTTRIRRGRFYVPNNPTRADWQAAWVNNYPYGPPVGDQPRFYSCEAYTSFQGHPRPDPKKSLVLLGDLGQETAWRVVGAERLYNHEILITLRAVDTLGILPELNFAAIPAERRTDIQQAMEKVADAAHQYLPVPIVDLCRESARLLLAGWLQARGGGQVRGDLGDLIKQIAAESECMSAAARILARLHARGKSSEQDRQADRGVDLREIASADADLSVALYAFLLRETGWTM